MSKKSLFGVVKKTSIKLDGAFYTVIRLNETFLEKKEVYLLNNTDTKLELKYNQKVEFILPADYKIKMGKIVVTNLDAIKEFYILDSDNIRQKVYINCQGIIHYELSNSDKYYSIMLLDGVGEYKIDKYVYLNICSKVKLLGGKQIGVKCWYNLNLEHNCINSNNITLNNDLIFLNSSQTGTITEINERNGNVKVEFTDKKNLLSKVFYYLRKDSVNPPLIGSKIRFNFNVEETFSSMHDIIISDFSFKEDTIDEKLVSKYFYFDYMKEFYMILTGIICMLTYFLFGYIEENIILRENPSWFLLFPIFLATTFFLKRDEYFNAKSLSIWELSASFLNIKLILALQFFVSLLLIMSQFFCYFVPDHNVVLNLDKKSIHDKFLFLQYNDAIDIKEVLDKKYLVIKTKHNYSENILSTFSLDIPDFSGYSIDIIVEITPNVNRNNSNLNVEIKDIIKSVKKDYDITNLNLQDIEKNIKTNLIHQISPLVSKTIVNVYLKESKLVFE